jgi:hypothetical protein
VFNNNSFMDLISAWRNASEFVLTATVTHLRRQKNPSRPIKRPKTVMLNHEARAERGYNWQKQLFECHTSHGKGSSVGRQKLLFLSRSDTISSRAKKKKP